MAAISSTITSLLNTPSEPHSSLPPSLTHSTSSPALMSPTGTPTEATPTTEDPIQRHLSAIIGVPVGLGLSLLVLGCCALWLFLSSYIKYRREEREQGTNITNLVSSHIHTQSLSFQMYKLQPKLYTHTHTHTHAHARRTRPRELLQLVASRLGRGAPSPVATGPGAPVPPSPHAHQPHLTHQLQTLPSEQWSFYHTHDSIFSTFHFHVS